MEAKTKKKTEIHKEEITDPKEEVEKLRMECQRLLKIDLYRGFTKKGRSRRRILGGLEQID